MKEILCFVHIPKTGGNSFKWTIFNVFSIENVMKVWGKAAGDQDFDRVEFKTDVDAKMMSTYGAVVGHYRGFDLAKKVKSTQGDITFWNCSIVRDPIDRVISEWNYSLQKPHLHKKISDVSFEEFCKKHKNKMSQWLYPTTEFSNLIDWLNEYQFTLCTTSNIAAIQNKVIDKYGIRNKDYSSFVDVHHNQSTKVLFREDLGPQLIDTLKEYNSLDYQLFDLVRASGGLLEFN